MKMHRWIAIFVVLLSAASLPAGAEDGITDTSILIGQTIGLTGTVAAPVKEMNEGAKAYIDSVNRAGGVNGRKIELRILDDGFVPKKAAANADKLIKEEHVFALFQTRGTPHTEAVAPILEASGVPLVAPSSGAALFHQPVNRLIFNVRAPYQTEVIKGIEHFTTLGYKKIGVLHVDDSFGRDGLAGFLRGMAERKLEPVIVASFAREKPDVNAAAAQLIKADPKALIIVSSSKNTVDVIKAIRAQGGSMQIMTLSNNSSDSFVKDLGPAGVGLIVSQVTPAADLVSSVLGKEFQAAAKASGATRSYAAMDGFVSAKVLVEGLRRAGRNLTRESFIRALESIHQLDLGGLLVDYGPKDHTGSEFVELTMIGRNGRFVR